jgi:transposase
MRQQANRDRRIVRNEAVMEQLCQRVTQVEIARRLGLGLRTIRRWVRAHGFPERKSTSRATKADLYGEFLRQRWQEGCHNASQLWRELREQGITGQHASVRNWIRKYYGPRSCRREKNSTFSPATRASPRQTAWLLLKQPENVRPYLEGLCRRSAPIAACASLARTFCYMIRQRDATMWLSWREEAKNSLLAGFAKHLCRDEAALLAALKQPWSNGPVEEQIHRLKLIKRSMYGRAGFDLIRLRVVLPAA